MLLASAGTLPRDYSTAARRMTRFKKDGVRTRIVCQKPLLGLSEILHLHELAIVEVASVLAAAVLGDSSPVVSQM